MIVILIIVMVGQGFFRHFGHLSSIGNHSSKRRGSVVWPILLWPDLKPYMSLHVFQPMVKFHQSDMSMFSV